MRTTGVCVVASVICVASDAGARRQAADAGRWTSEFVVAREDWASEGRNPFFVLEPGYQLVLENGNERLAITVLDETRVIDGVTTRVVEERESSGGKVTEVSRNYFAISRRTGSVYYFGEDVEMPGKGDPKEQLGSWLAGAKGARFGLMMPGEPLLGARYYQEYAPRAAMDRAEVISVNGRITTPAGDFGKCLIIEESTPLEPGVKERKYYARGIGLVADGRLRLVRRPDIPLR